MGLEFDTAGSSAGAAMLQQKMSRHGESGNAFLRRWSPKVFHVMKVSAFSKKKYDSEVDDLIYCGWAVGMFSVAEKQWEEMMITSIGTEQITINLTSTKHCNYRIHQDPSAYLSCFVPMLFFKFVSKRKALPFSESQAIWYSWHKSTRNVDVFPIGNQKHPGSCAHLFLWLIWGFKILARRMIKIYGPKK